MAASPEPGFALAKLLKRSLEAVADHSHLNEASPTEVRWEMGQARNAV
jgi:hypothetical protein